MSAQVPPQDQWGIDPLFWSYLHLSIQQIYRLGTIRALEGSFILPNGRPVSKAQIVGVVVTVKRESSSVLYAIDDGTGLIQCNKFLNDSHTGEDTAVEIFKLGDLVRAIGSLSKYKGTTEIKIVNIHKVPPNDEIYHWLQNMKLTKLVYSQPLRHDAVILQELAYTNHPIPSCKCGDFGGFRQDILYCRCLASIDESFKFDTNFNFRFALIRYFMCLGEDFRSKFSGTLRVPYKYLVNACLLSPSVPSSSSLSSSSLSGSLYVSSASSLSSSLTTTSASESTCALQYFESPASSPFTLPVNQSKMELYQIAQSVGEQVLLQKPTLTIEYLVKRLLQRTLVKLIEDGVLSHDMIDNDSYELLDKDIFLKPILVQTLKQCHNTNSELHSHQQQQQPAINIFSVDTLKELAARQDGRIKEVSDIRIQLCLAQIHKVDHGEYHVRENGTRDKEGKHDRGGGGGGERGGGGVDNHGKRFRPNEPSLGSGIDDMLDEAFNDTFARAPRISSRKHMYKELTNMAKTKSVSSSEER